MRTWLLLEQNTILLLIPAELLARLRPSFAKVSLCIYLKLNDATKELHSLICHNFSDATLSVQKVENDRLMTTGAPSIFFKPNWGKLY